MSKKRKPPDETPGPTPEPPPTADAAETGAAGPQLPAVPETPEAMVAQTRQWILMGNDAHDVADAVRTAWPDQDPKPLITAALESIAAAACFDPDLVVGFAIEAARDLYRAMREIGDFSGALKAVKLLHDFATAHTPRECSNSEPEPATNDPPAHPRTPTPRA